MESTVIERYAQVREIYPLARQCSIAALYVLALGLPISSDLPYHFATGIGALIFAAFWLQGSDRRDPNARMAVALALSICISALLVIFYHQDRFSLYAINPVAATGLAICLISVNIIHVRIVMYCLYGIIGMIIAAGIDIDNSVISIGQNGITLHLLVIYTVYFFVAIHTQARTHTNAILSENYFFAACLFTVAVWSQGRAATLTAFAVFCSATFILLKGPTTNKALVVILSAFIILMNYCSPPLMGDRPYSSVDRIAMAGIQDVRFSLWLDYFKTITLEASFFGNRDSNCHLILTGYNQGNCNIHNSYLRAHQVYGLLGSLVFVLALAYCIRRFIAQRAWCSGVIFVALLARIATDESFFTHIYLFALIVIFLSVSKLYPNSRLPAA